VLLLLLILPLLLITHAAACVLLLSWASTTWTVPWMAGILALLFPPKASW